MHKKRKPVKYQENMEEVFNKELRFHLENPFRKEDAIYHMDLAVEGCSGYAQDIIDRIKADKLEGSKGKWHAKRLATFVLSIDNMWRRYCRPILAKEGKERG